MKEWLAALKRLGPRFEGKSGLIGKMGKMHLIQIEC
jgi:hypothetical protein